MIEVLHVTKRYGDTVAVDDLSFTVQPGVVTGFLGPNGAGKSTTMRMIRRPRPARARARSASTVAPIATSRARCTRSGALLEARAVHGGRSARNHLLAMAQTHGIDRSRVEDVIGLVGLAGAAGARVGSFSLGMCQRLGIAAALLGDPGIVILDEPTNGLDPEGIVWIRGLLRDLAAEGRTVFLSSHLMSEMALTADHLIIVGRGRLIAETTVEDVVHHASSGGAVRVRTPHAETLAGRARARARRRARIRARGRARRARRHGRVEPPDRRGRGEPRARAARADTTARVARGRLHGPDR